jgi:hypothetical protein
MRGLRIITRAIRKRPTIWQFSDLMDRKNPRMPGGALGKFVEVGWFSELAGTFVALPKLPVSAGDDGSEPSAFYAGLSRDPSDGNGERSQDSRSPEIRLLCSICAVCSVPFTASCSDRQ